jgi:hypothetical protein
MKVQSEATFGQFETKSPPGRRYEHTILQPKEVGYINKIRRRGNIFAITIEKG